jgi:hypothetical protein
LILKTKTVMIDFNKIARYFAICICMERKNL